MPPPSIKCAICAAETSKRQTLLIEPYGRICRSHPEVEQHKAKLAEVSQRAADDRKFKQAMQNLSIIMIVERIRMESALSGLPLEFCAMAITFRCQREFRDKIMAEVRAKGPISQKEMEDAVFMAAYMHLKGQHRDLPAPAAT